MVQLGAGLVGSGGSTGTALLHERGQGGGEVALDLGQRQAVLGSAGPGHAGLHLAQVQLHHFGVNGLGLPSLGKEALFLAISFDQLDGFVAASGEPQVGEGLVVDGEEPAGGAVLGRHVGDSRPVGEG